MKNEIRYFSMFTGVGGFELGLQGNRCSQSKSRRSKKDLFPRGTKSTNKKFKCIGFSEIDKYSNQVLKYRFPNIKNYGDATKINPRELPDFDMLCGGFPCQSFSIAGKRRGFEDTRGTMFFEIARILKVKRPKIVLLENVKGLLNHQKGETFRKIIQTLSELGYNVQWMVLNSKFFGVSQNRERVFIIGSFGGTSRPEILPFKRADTETNQEGIIHPTLTEAIGRQGCSKEYIKSCQTILDINQAQRVYSTEGTSTTIKGLGGGQGAKTGLYAISNKSPREFKWQTERSPTLQARDYKDPKLVKQNMKIRRLTPTECERLQGFPDGWTKYGINEKGEKVKMSDTQRYKQMGNAVTVKVIRAIGEKLKQEEEK